MLTNEVILDLFSRIENVVHKVLKDISDDDLTSRPSPEANTIAWLVWHLTRIQDDHIADLTGSTQVWDEWYEKFGFSFSKDATGYGQSADEVAEVKASSKLLLAYFDAVNKQTVNYVKTLKTEDYSRIVDANWEPPVTLAVRLASIISDDLQHAGQAAYIKGI
ncbi:MAG: DinB family protein [Candidatus Saccharibacteria bacterium]